jgi:5-formyltetrahydrofolate cyclo-ligase
MSPDELKRWRRAERERLVAARVALPAATRESRHRSIDQHLQRAFPGLARAVLAFCWPIRGEYDARHLARALRERGATTALPVVLAPRTPLAFREWHPGVALARGALDIPYPIGSQEVDPGTVLLPMNGWDGAGYRLGYGGGFFDRTLAARAQKKPLVVGVALEAARIDTIHPQSWDVPMDYVVTERGVYRRDPQGLAFLGAPEPGAGSASASPVCYADEAFFADGKSGEAR